MPDKQGLIGCGGFLYRGKFLRYKKLCWAGCAGEERLDKERDDRMYRVLFAEDELLVRLGLQNSIPWERFDMELAGEAENGREAYEKFLKLRPDVVITDIKMEGMDGYELIRKIREMDSRCAIIIISCLDDFEALRKMMGYCIIGYILKASMTMEEIFSVMTRAKEYLDRMYENREQSCGTQDAAPSLIRAYLREGTGEERIRWKAETGLSCGQIRSLSVLRLKAPDQGKINGLAMKLIFKLLRQWMQECYFLETEEYEITVLESREERELREGYRRFNDAVEQFLGVSFERRSEPCGESTLPEVYRKARERFRTEEQEDSVIDRAILYLKENCRRQLTLPEIAGELGLSPNYFSALFKKETGQNYVDFLSEVRLENILRDLRTTDDKIQLVAERNGFPNLEYFSRFFKKRMGVSPARWRQQNR